MYSILKRNAERIRIFLMIILVTLCTICLYVFWGSEDQFKKDLCYEIITGVMFTTLTICVISIFNWLIGRKELDDAHDQKITQYLIDLMRGRNIRENLISSLYNEMAAREIMKNSVSYFNSILCDSYCTLIENYEPVIRKDFDYRVKMFKSKRHDKGIILEQYLKYRRYFRTDGIRKEKYELKCCFTFSTSVLNKFFDDNSFFLREEIQDKDLVMRISEAIEHNNNSLIIELLNIRIYLSCNKKEVAIANTEYIVDPILDSSNIIGIIVKIEIPAETEYIKEENGMANYMGRVSFSIPIPKTNRFYCIFADPVIGETNFSIEFDPDLIDDINSVDFLQLLTVANKKNFIETEPNRYQKEFKTSETILPISGIVAFW